uniref:NADH dehydrogenase subunit 3 n=1 Tax=Arrugada affinis TaxID=706857 RepID=UPI002E75F02C|nr:NADH dehydrogenase subunit 3 [Arrugada affinis]WRK21420.1 NADH dehydrogenase subunit 3 [Arrugada affinis]
MNLMIISMSTIFMISFMIVMMILVISKKALINTQKSTPFECGFNPMSYSRLPFSIHFFMVAVIFLIFDIEIILMMPMILTYKMSMLKYWMITSVSFTLILLLGLLHEWVNGMIEWTK